MPSLNAKRDLWHKHDHARNSHGQKRRPGGVLRRHRAFRASPFDATRSEAPRHAESSGVEAPVSCPGNVSATCSGFASPYRFYPPPVDFSSRENPKHAPPVRRSRDQKREALLRGPIGPPTLIPTASVAGVFTTNGYRNLRPVIRPTLKLVVQAGAAKYLAGVIFDVKVAE